MTVTYTTHFRWGIPDFTTEPWHSQFQALVVSMDKTAYQLFIAAGAVVWTNSTAFAVGDIAIDGADGTIWICDIAHTSATSPTTFAQDRAANPSFWTEFIPDTDAASAADSAIQAKNAAGAALAIAGDAKRQAARTLQRAQIILTGAVQYMAESQRASRTSKNAALNSLTWAGLSSAQAGAASSLRRRTAQAAQQAATSVSAAATFAAMAARERRRAQALASGLTDDQIAFKAAVFNG
jgi:hypothetical protein